MASAGELLVGTNISPKKGTFEDDVLFQVGYVSFVEGIFVKLQGCSFLYRPTSFPPSQGLSEDSLPISQLYV